ncbi:DUF6660 family protein [Flaviaesturariibacter amylovorans]|uniref:DUF6660 family protein n=1 Tax=Flaviaesturariibacter amylovorans TaxID=1084520 RepID=UPI003CC5C2CC
MRIFAFLMAVLVLALSMMPCADSDITGKQDPSHSLVKTSGDHQNDEPEDNCSPFCQCTCCAGFFLNHATAAIAYHPVLPPASRFPHPPAAILDRSLPVWQPPQLG